MNSLRPSINGKKIIISFDGKEVARAFLYLMSNELHTRPFGFMEDVYVDESLRGMGLGSRIVNEVIEEAKRSGCYKLICTSRHSKPRVQALYGKLGFSDHGKEFRIDF